MSRLIDADALTKTLIPLWNCHDDSEFANKDIWQAIENAPTIKPEPHWIPCSERLPEKPDMYIVTDNKGAVEKFVFTGSKSGCEYWLRYVKAWMPLPESYRKDGEQNG